GVWIAMLVSVTCGTKPGTVILSLAATMTVFPKANALPSHVTSVPNVIPAGSITVPVKLLVVPSVVATGVQNISEAFAPLISLICEFAIVFSAPEDLKTYVPGPSRTIPAVPTDWAPAVQ